MQPSVLIGNKMQIEAKNVTDISLNGASSLLLPYFASQKRVEYLLGQKSWVENPYNVN